MQDNLTVEKRKYNKKNDFMFKFFFNEEGELFEKVIENTFGRYCMRSERLEVRSKKLW